MSRSDRGADLRTYFTTLKGRIPHHCYGILDPKVQLYGDIFADRRRAR